MTLEELKKWIDGVECHYNHDFTELWVCPATYDLLEFFKINSPGIFDDGGIDCKICYKYVAFDLVPIAEYYGIDIDEVLHKIEENK
jgi:hypothetical protein